MAWQRSSMRAQPPISCPSVSGVASCRCVRPILTRSMYRSDLARKHSRIFSSAGSTPFSTASTAATCSAVGNVSLLLWLRLTWSLGWIFRPKCSEARWAITSLTFMLLWVPLPVCQTLSGNSSQRPPASSSSAACMIAAAVSASSAPRRPLAAAAAFLRIRKASMIPRGIVSVPMRKFS